VSVASPLAPPDAAALAISVKVLLWGTSPPPPPVTPPPPAPAPPPSAPAPTLPPASIELTREPLAPTFTVELAVGARLEPVATQHAALRFGARAAWAPALAERRLAFGAGVEAGPSLALGASHVDDVVADVFVRGRQRVGDSWLELGVGPALHFVAVETGPASDATALALASRLGFVVPLGRTFVGARAGATRLLTSSPLPRWSGDLALVAGVALW
jgi:hypothetical protein